jgi:hypothetical protein
MHLHMLVRVSLRDCKNPKRSRIQKFHQMTRTATLLCTDGWMDPVKVTYPGDGGLKRRLEADLHGGGELL